MGGGREGEWEKKGWVSGKRKSELEGGGGVGGWVSWKEEGWVGWNEEEGVGGLEGGGVGGLEGGGVGGWMGGLEGRRRTKVGRERGR